MLKITRMLAINTAVLLGLSLLLIGCRTFASSLDSVRQYPFINLNANRIILPNGSALPNAFAQLIHAARVGEKPLRILHLGDSHVHADIFTAQTRTLLARFLSDGSTSRGFTFPYRIAGVNNPSDYRVRASGNWKPERISSSSISANLGVAGIALSTNDWQSSLSIELIMREFGNSPFDKVSILFQEDSTHTMIPYLTASSQLVSRKEGFIAYQLLAPADSLTIRLSPQLDGPHQFKLFGVELSNSNGRLMYSAAGVNGASLNSYLMSSNLLHGLSLINPDVVVVSLGTNDVYDTKFDSTLFERNLVNLVGQISITLPRAIIILTTPGDHLVKRTVRNPGLDKARLLVISVSQRMGCGVWDFHSVMGGEGSIKHWVQSGLAAPDAVHLTPQGYRLKGSLFFQSLVGLASEDATSLEMQPQAGHEQH